MGVLATCQAIKRPNQVIFKVVVKEYGVFLKLDAKFDEFRKFTLADYSSLNEV